MIFRLTPVRLAVGRVLAGTVIMAMPDLAKDLIETPAISGRFVGA